MKKLSGKSGKMYVITPVDKVSIIDIFYDKLFKENKYNDNEITEIQGVKCYCHCVCDLAPSFEFTDKETELTSL